MTKKEYILSIIDSIKDIWNQADEVIEYLNQDEDQIEEKMLDMIIDHIESAVKSAENETQKDAFNKSLDKLKKIKSLESESNEENENGLDKMMSEIDDLYN